MRRHPDSTLDPPEDPVAARLLVAIAAGLLLGGGLGLAWRGAASPPARERPAMAPSPGPPPARTGEHCSARVEALRPTLEGLRTRVAFLRGQQEVMTPPPDAWPADLPAAVTPQGALDALTPLVAAHDGLSLVDVDCSAYPCLVAIRGQDDGSAALPAVPSPFQERVQLGTDDDHVRIYEVTAAGRPPSEHTPDAQQRLQQLEERLAHRWSLPVPP